MEEQDVYCAQFVNLKILTFVLFEKKTADLFSKYDKIQHTYKRPQLVSLNLGRKVTYFTSFSL